MLLAVDVMLAGTVNVHVEILQQYVVTVYEEVTQSPVGAFIANFLIKRIEHAPYADQDIMH